MIVGIDLRTDFFPVLFFLGGDYRVRGVYPPHFVKSLSVSTLMFVYIAYIKLNIKYFKNNV